MRAPPSITIDPPGARWGPALRAWLSARDDVESALFRRELGLPTDAPIVMTGHQPWVWHCGILAKYLACEAAARSLGARPAWVWVDQDEVNPFALRVPVDEAGGVLRARDGLIGPPPQPGAAVGSLPAGRVTPAPVAPPGAARVAEALNAHAGAPTAARQAAGALADLMRPHVPTAPGVFATELHRTSLFRSLVERMRSDPGACARAYNDAVEATPDAGLSPLSRTEATELPLWITPPGAPRERVFAATIASADAQHFAPRALYLTLLLRLAGCDLFIHGVGGGRYDRATERWARAWLGRDLAPLAVVSATALLEFDRPAPPSPADAARASWLAHHARHDPAVIGLAKLSMERAALLDRVRRAKAGGVDPGPAYRSLQDFLEGYRRANAEALASLQRDASTARARAGEHALVMSREWAFPLHSAETLGALRDAIVREFTPRG